MATYYTVSGNPITQSRGASKAIRDEFTTIVASFDSVDAALALKAPLASPTFTGTVVLPDTMSIGNVSATEITYLDGVTSAIQTQLNALVVVDALKAPLANPDLTGVPTANTATAGTSTRQLATTEFVTATAFAAELPTQTGHNKKFITTDGGNATWAYWAPYYDSGTTNALNCDNGLMQRWAPSVGGQTLTITNWQVAGLAELFIQGVNLGASTITWPTINWVKFDGTFTTTFSENGVTLQSSGTDFVLLWTRDGGTTIYGKVVR